MNTRHKEELLTLQDDGVEEMSTWINQTEHTARFEVTENTPAYRAKDGSSTGCGKRRRIVLPPGEMITLPAYLDQAIQQRLYNKDTKEPMTEIVGGVCPWLTKVGGEDVPLSPALDFETAIMAEKLEMLSRKASTNKALAIKAQQLAEAEDKIDQVADMVSEKTKTRGRPRKSAV